MRRALARRWARAPLALRAGIVGGTGILVVALVALVMTRNINPLAPFAPTPTPTPGPSFGPAPTLSVQAGTQLLGRVLPTPSTTDTALLVQDPASLTGTEQRWLSDLQANLGNVNPLAYKDATTDRLRGYFVVFVIDQSSDLDPKGLAGAYAAGVSIHLVGAATAYQAQVGAGVSQ
jgi:hypothetical protein